MRALILVACWLALSVPLALLVSRIMRAAEGSGGIGDEAERWLRARSRVRRPVVHAMVRAGLAVFVLAPLVAAGAVAAWRLPDQMTVARADGQLALSWPPGQPDETTTTTTTAAAAEVAAAGTATPSINETEHDAPPAAAPEPAADEATVGAPARAEPASDDEGPTPTEGDAPPTPSDEEVADHPEAAPGDAGACDEPRDERDRSGRNEGPEDDGHDEACEDDAPAEEPTEPTEPAPDDPDGGEVDPEPAGEVPAEPPPGGSVKPAPSRSTSALLLGIP